MSHDGWSLRRRVDQGTTVALVLLIGLVAVLVVALLDVKHKGDEVINRWDPAFQDSQDALAAMVNQETGLRGYAVAQQDAFLQPFRDYQRPEQRAEDSLARSLAGDDDLLALLRTFESRVDEWHRDIAEPFISRVAVGDDTVAAAAVDTQAKASFDRLRAASADLTRGIDERRDDASAQRSRAFAIVWTVSGVGTLLLLAVGLALAVALRRTILDPISALVDDSRRVASGHLDQSISRGGPREIAGLGADVEAMRGRLVAELGRAERARQRVLRANDELERSNADLEQFAYVASHDLSEPLRKVTNFCQLLERQYAEQLDDRARTYIGFMVDGARRMQTLINDLLAFSRVGRTTDHFAPVDLDQALARALANVETALQAAGGRVDADPLPTVPGDPTLLVALLQNLVSNAVKYSDPDRPPQVRITARPVGEGAEEAWEISVADNGIGIDQQYAERIFAIFQRLHLRDQYGGTGIGLALCRKIVDFHDGRIWLAEPDADNGDGDGVGSTFRLTLPVRHQARDDLDDDLDEAFQNGSGGDAAAEPTPAVPVGAAR